MPETSFNSYIRECAEDCSAYMRLSSKRREENLAEQRYDEMQRQSVTVLSCLVNLCTMNWVHGRKLRMAILSRHLPS